MTATAHVLVAGAIAARFADPITAGIFALTSHFVLDSIPHWDFGTNWRNRPKRRTGAFAILDTVIGFTLSYLIFGSSSTLIVWLVAVVCSVLPDWLETPWYILYANQSKHIPGKHASVLEKVSYAFYKIPNIFHTKAQFPLGLITQVAAVIFFITLLMN
jgi:hypothetical protein